jgi:hypothetical protein
VPAALNTYGRVGAPDVNIGILDRRASLVVNDLDGQGHLDTLLALRIVLADLLALHVERALIDNWHLDAGTRVGEQRRWVGLESDGLVALVADLGDRDVAPLVNGVPVLC